MHSMSLSYGEESLLDPAWRTEPRYFPGIESAS